MKKGGSGEPFQGKGSISVCNVGTVPLITGAVKVMISDCEISLGLGFLGGVVTELGATFSLVHGEGKEEFKEMPFLHCVPESNPLLTWQHL